MKFYAYFLVGSVLVLWACSKDQKVDKNTNNTSLLGEWMVNTAVGTYYLNDSLQKDTAYSSPFGPGSEYTDWLSLVFTKDSIFFFSNDSTEERELYKVHQNKLVLHYFDSLDYSLFNRTLKIKRIDEYYDLQGNHQDTVVFSLSKK